MCHNQCAVKRETPNQQSDKTINHRNSNIDGYVAAFPPWVLSVAVTIDGKTITIKNNQSGGGVSE